MEFILPNYRIPARVVASTLYNASAPDMTTRTWATTAGTAHSLSTATVSPDARYTAVGVSDTVPAGGWDPSLVWELPAAIATDDLCMSVMFWMDALPSTVAGYSSVPLVIRASIDAGVGVLTNRYEYNGLAFPERWNFLQIGGMADTTITTATQRSGWTITGTVANGTTIKRVQLYSNGGGGFLGTMFIPRGGITFGARSPKIVIVSFDDGFASFYSAVYPLLQTYGIAVTHNIITSFLGAGGYVTLAQCQEMYASGLVSFSNHTHSHWDSTTIASKTQAEVTTDITTCTTSIINGGLNDSYNSAYCCAWPYGNSGYGTTRSKILGACADAGIVSVRGTLNALEGYGNSDPKHGSCIFMDYTVTASRAQQLMRRINNFVSGAGGVMRIGAHDINNANTGTTGYPVSEFTQVLKQLAGLRDAGQIIIMTEAEYQSMANLGTIGALVPAA